MTYKLRIFAIACCSIMLSVLAFGAQEFRIPLLSHPPVIDGKIEAGEWAGCAGFDGLGYNDVLKQQRAQAYAGADEHTLYFAIRTQLPDVGNLISADRDQLSGMYYADDTVSIQINAQPEQQNQVLYQLLVNHLGRYRYRVHLKNNAQEDPGWEGHWKTASSFRNGFWEFECAAPISSMSNVAAGRKTTDGLWMIDLCRDYKGPNGSPTSLSGTGVNAGFSSGGVHYMTGMPFRFVSAAPVVQYSVSSDPFQTDFRGTLALYNPGAGPLQLSASILLDRDRMPEILTTKQLTLAPGQRENLSLLCPKDDATTQFIQHITVKSADGNTIFYDRATKWPKAAALVYQGADVKVNIDPLKVDFAYYPYENSMRVAVDISGMTPAMRNGLTRLSAIIHAADSKRSIAMIDLPLNQFKQGKLEQKFTLPELKGAYELVIQPEGVTAPAAVTKPFERTVYEWEHNTLGLSTRVYPPFTPIKVTGNRLSTVLREHTLNNVGLLDQVTGQSVQTGNIKPLLAGPMRYVVRIAGQNAPIKSSPIKIVSQQANEVKTDAAFSAGALRATSRSTWDYDGTVKVDLTLLPSNGKRVDELTLEIPLDENIATLIHANADRIRAPVAEYIPQGTGVVWDASKVSSNDWPKRFCPYIFLGNAARGLCWFAENDRGWSWNAETPNLEVVRTGKTVLLRIHLINTPLIIKQPRTITFGLLAAPVKPRIDPAQGPNWWRYRYTRDQYSLLGTDINWLALGDCAAVYPAGKDMYLWEMIAKGNKEHLTDAQVQSVIDRGQKYFAPYGQDVVNTFIAHARHNLLNRYGTKMVYYYNRASYQACEEFQTFMDEWTCDNLRVYGKGPSRAEIKVVPCTSYNDYCMYWYNKSFDIGGNQGVYWDNLFIIPSFNTEKTAAYRLADGTVRPAAGIWAMRELVKRTFILENERGMLPITFPHMTSFNCLPLMSFSTVQYDWEWKYSEGEAQDRFTREYILLATQGEQAGVWPVPLGDAGAQANDPWIQRSMRAVRMLHELDNPCDSAVLAMLDQPNLQVYRYWDDRPQPITSGNKDLPVIVYSVPGKETLVVVVSYLDHDSTVNLSVNPTTLGFTNGYIVTDAEVKTDTPQAVPLSFTLKKHDMRMLRLLPKTGDSTR